MTKKKQSKRSAKQGAKKTSGSGVAPTLHEIPAMEPPLASQDAHALSAPEPIVTEPVAPDLAAAPTSNASIAEVVTIEAVNKELTSATTTPSTSSASSVGTNEAPESKSAPAAPEPPKVAESAPAAPEPPKVAESAPAATEPPKVAESAPAAPEPPKVAESAPATPEPPKSPESSPPIAPVPAVTASAPVMPSPSITNDIPTLPAVAAAASQEPAHPQKTTYDLEVMGTIQAAPAQDLAAAPNPPLNNSPSINPQSLGSLTRSKSSSEVSRALPGKEEPKWRPPVDYFGASASAFSSSFSGNRNRDPNTINRPGDAPQAPFPQTPSSQAPAQQTPPQQASAQQTPAQQTPPQQATSGPSASSPPTSPQNPPAQPNTPAPVYEPATDTSALSPKMAKFVSSLRERELTASGASSPVLPQLEATSVDIAPLPPQPPVAPPKISPVTSAKQAEPKSAPDPGPVTAQPSRDIPVAKTPSPQSGPRPEPKAFGEELPLAPKSSSQVAELRESIISQRADGKAEDWHPVPGKKSPRSVDPQISAELEHLKKPEQSKQKPDPDRHLSLEEMAAMDPDLALPTQTPQQQSIRRLKSKTTGGIHAEIYIPIYIICLGLGWVTEQSAAAGTCRDAGQRIESALQLLSPKSLADNFVAGLNVYDEREIKLHPFNPNKRPNPVQFILGRILAFCSGLSSAFGRIPATIAASSATNPLAEIMILLSYTSILVLSLLIFFKFKRSTNWSIADFILLPIGLATASTLITAVLIAVLSMSQSLAASYLPNTIILYTTVAVVLAVLDMARRSFLGRKQAIVRD